MPRPANKEKANLKLQIRNAEVQFAEAVEFAEQKDLEARLAFNDVYELDLKLSHLESKLKKLAGKSSGENKAKKS